MMKFALLALFSVVVAGQELCSTGAASFDAAPFDAGFTMVATVDALTPGFAILEGPTWFEDRLYMSHIGFSNGVDQNPAQIVRLADDNTIEVHLNNSGSNGMVVTARNEVFAALHGRPGENGRVSIIDLNDNADIQVFPEVLTLVDTFNDIAFNSPNDVAVSSRYNVYFTDPSFQSPNQNTMMPPQDAERAYYLLSGQSIATAFGVGVIDRPNGVLLNQDESQLYVGGQNGLFVFPVSCGGYVEDTPTQIQEGVLSGIDGMTRDCLGNIYVTANGTVNVLNPANEIIATTDLAGVTNLVFGGPELTTLYATTLGTNPMLFSLRSTVSGENLMPLGGERSSGSTSLLECCEDEDDDDGEPTPENPEPANPANPEPANPDNNDGESSATKAAAAMSGVAAALLVSAALAM